ncbi:hypothetical protein CR513_31325, partial [Mucuna pruriens]
MVIKVAMVLLEGIMTIKGQKIVEAYNKIKAQVMESIMVDNATKVAFSWSLWSLSFHASRLALMTQVEESYKIALDAYVPILKDVTNELNLHVHSTWENNTTTRRKG